MQPAAYRVAVEDKSRVVAANMVHQIILPLELGRAVITVQPFPLSVLVAKVPGQVSLSGTAFTAQFTDVGLDFAVGHHVAVEQVDAVEHFMADGALFVFGAVGDGLIVVRDVEVADGLAGHSAVRKEMKIRFGKTHKYIKSRV